MRTSRKDAQPPLRIGPPPEHHAGVTYKVDQLRETLIGDKINTGDLESLLNARAAEGYSLKTTVRAPVKGRVGPGGADAIILIFERPLHPPGAQPVM